MDELLKNLSLLPTWARALLAAIALIPIYRLARATVFKPATARRTDREYRAWEEVLGPLGWTGKIERGLSTSDVDLKFEREEGEHAALSLYGETGRGNIQFYGETSGVHLSIDLREASEAGARAALRTSSNAATLIARLGAEGEAALEALAGCFGEEVERELSLLWSLKVEWVLPYGMWDEESARTVTDHEAFVRHMMTLQRTLLRDDEVDAPDVGELLELSQRGPGLRAMLSMRALLVLHAGTPQAEELIQTLRDGGDDARAMLLGWSLDDATPGGRGATDEERLEARVGAIARADLEMGPLLARHARRVHPIEDLVRVARARFGGESSTPQKTRDRDGHVFACHIIGSFKGEADAGDFAIAYPRLVTQVSRNYTYALPFSDMMGELNAWHEDLVVCALGTAAHDDVYTFWSHALGEVWRPSLAARLLEVVASEAIQARGLCAILEEAAAQEDFRLLAPGRLAVSVVNEHWSTDDDERQKMREQLKELELAFAGAKRDGGQLTLSTGEGGGLSLQAPGESGGLEVAQESPQGTKTSR